MSDGWLKTYRKLKEWEWYTDSHMVHLFLHLILSAAPEDRMWQGVKIRRGQVIVSRQKLSVETGISEMTIRTCMGHLVESGEIKVESTNRFTVVTVCQYDRYQNVERQTNQPTNQPINQQNSQQINQPTNHNIRSKEDNNNILELTPPDGAVPQKTPNQPKKPKLTKEEVEAATNARMKVFYDSLIPYVQRYGKEMVRQFYNFWSEPNKSKSKMRWETEKTWELERRLATWERKSDEFNRNRYGTDRSSNQSGAEQRMREGTDIVARLLAEDDAKEAAGQS